MKQENQNIVNEQPHSVKFAVNAKGMWSGEVKIYSDHPETAFNKAKHLAESMSTIIANRNNMKGDVQ